MRRKINFTGLVQKIEKCLSVLTISSSVFCAMVEKNFVKTVAY